MIRSSQVDQPNWKEFSNMVVHNVRALASWDICSCVSPGVALNKVNAFEEIKPEA